MPKKTTIYDIAKALNITAATVSRALNDSPRVKKATKELILETAKQMNYEQNKLAQALKSGKSYNVGVIVPYINSNFFASVIRGIEEELYPKGYHVIICQTHDQENLEIENINSLLNAQVDGVLMSISNSNIENNPAFKNLVRKHVPLIFFDRKKDIKGVSSVTIDDFKGAYMATQHLIEQGCKRIAHLSNDQSLEIFQNRFLGYKQAILDAGFELDSNLVVETTSKVESGSLSTKKLLSLNNPPDGIFASCDFSALGAIKEIKTHGLSIPDDISVIGFSNEPFSQFMELSITSIDQSPMEMGRIAANVFLDEVNSKGNVKSEKQVILAPELIVRKSSQKESLILN
ncbi:LacI family DNA-binding transcriptional regulator [Aestuariibaculum sp. YM273]|uniref:LacI family DNA-binding transcriptional regulator n=1 Tax=Aestuariibaculum sp. YM273 TaxID=3070659 RepID=UPI0027DE08EC|nr:LacI family DNA-binding transcriptional regulator [Aestuariibaculum sp. YM273]WMI66299.1 LacI family DNA-binding transcriptional regulator [Aestuariibaculum sp. YM273]